jgi:hypothetical protein
MHTVPPANNLKSLANLKQELCHLAKVDRSTAMGTTVLNFFDLPPAPFKGSRRCRFAVGKNRTMSFSSLSSGYPITARMIFHG